MKQKDQIQDSNTFHWNLRSGLFYSFLSYLQNIISSFLKERRRL